MGREALITVEVGQVRAVAKVVLESTELIVRAPILRRFATSAIRDLHCDGDALRLRIGDDSVVLHLGEKAAATWAKAITTPPPTLRDKLGLADAARAFVIGSVEAESLALALKGRTTTVRAAADMVIAIVNDADALRSAMVAATDGTPVPLWAVYPKGRGVAFGDAAIREALRGEGFRDTKSCAVSERLTATRYSVAAR